MNIAIMLVVLLAGVFLLVLSFRAIYFAFVKKKDERSKLIVIKSMASSFTVIVIFQTLLYIFKAVKYDIYMKWWNSFKEGLYIEPALLSFIVLGIILIINTKRYGGSL